MRRTRAKCMSLCGFFLRNNGILMARRQSLSFNYVDGRCKAWFCCGLQKFACGKSVTRIMDHGRTSPLMMEYYKQPSAMQDDGGDEVEVCVLGCQKHTTTLCGKCNYTESKKYPRPKLAGKPHFLVICCLVIFWHCSRGDASLRCHNVEQRKEIDQVRLHD